MKIDITEKQIVYFRSKILIYGRSNYDNFPWRSTNNKWHALAAEVMLRRTNAEQVLPVYESFCKIYEKPNDYIVKNEHNIFKSLGLPQRDKEFRELIQKISKNGIPEDKQLLKELSGVGEYIASAYRAFHLNKREIIIDSNAVRLYGRYFGFHTDGETRRKKWFIEITDRITPSRNFKDYNYGMLDFTRKICKPRPKCNECILSRRCKLQNV